MRKILTYLLVICAVSLSAQDATFDFSLQGYENAQQVTSGVIDATYNTMWQAIGGTPNAAYYSNGTALRIYQGGSFKISSTKRMAKVELTLGTGNKVYTFDQDAVQMPDDTAFTWTYSGSSGHVRIQKIEVSYVDYFTVQDLMDEYTRLNYSAGVTSTEIYKVRGYVTKWNSGYPQHQNADFFMDDSADGSISLLRCFRLPADNDADKRTLNVGDYIEAEAHLMNYNGQAELKDGTFHVVSSDIPPTPTYTLTITAGEGGSVNSSVNGTYEEDTEVSINATPSEGYEFKEWSDSNTENPRTIIMTEDIALTAYFVQTPTCVFPKLEGKIGNAILESLHDMIAAHTVLTYDQVRADRAQVDFRSDGTLWDMYSNCTFYSSDYCNNSNATTTTECDCYNREHSLPKSWWGSSTDEPMYTDLHHVISTDAASNSHRGADAYGEVSGTPDWSNSLGSKQGNTTTYTGGGYRKVFEPADMYKGDFARIYFYMITCYNDKNFAQGGQGYRMFTYSGSKADFTPAALNLLLKWHRADPVSEKELLRNNAVEAKQGNRNPFVDDPELVEYIWGTKKNTAYSCSEEDNTNNIDVITIEDNSSAQKILRNGQIYILRGDKTFTITGQEVK